MSVRVFANLWIIELGMIAAWMTASWVWRRQGPSRATTAFTLLLVLGEIAVVIVKGHPTEFAQFLAFTAAAVFVWRVFSDDEMRRVVIPQRIVQRFSRR